MNKRLIEEGKCILGIEFGSTRIKGILINQDYQVIASGSHDWENDFVNGIWTYSEKADVYNIGREFPPEISYAGTLI